MIVYSFIIAVIFGRKIKGPRLAAFCLTSKGKVAGTRPTMQKQEVGQ